MRHLFVVAHPDDEVLGAGAFIFDATRRGGNHEYLRYDPI